MLLRIVLLLAVTGAWVTFTVTQASATTPAKGKVTTSKVTISKQGRIGGTGH